MRRSVVTWRLTLRDFPSGAARERALQDAARLLEPIARIEMPIDHESLWRSDALSPWLLIEAERELTPGEIALSCLAKAHRLGRGWVLRWPDTPMIEPLRIDGARGRQPELLEGFCGWWFPSSEVDACPIAHLVEATFSVRILLPPPLEKPAEVAAQIEARPAERAEDLPREGDEATISRALVIWSGRGLHGWPKYDETRLERRLGAPAARALMPEIQRLMGQFYQIALDAGGGLWESAAVAARQFRETHPELSEEAIRALEWCYAYDMK